MLSVTSLKVSGSLCSFSKSYLPDTQVRIATVCGYCQVKNDVPWKKWLIQLATPTIMSDFPWENLVLQEAAEVLYVCLPFVTHDIKKMCSQGLNFTTVSNLVFHQNILK